MRSFGLLAWVWVLLLGLSGLGGSIVVSRVGWSLAMGLAIYTGNTEPLRPALPFPWAALGACLAVAALGALSAIWTRRRARARGEAPSALHAFAALAAAYAGAVLAALLPFVQVFRLFGATR